MYICVTQGGKGIALQLTTTKGFTMTYADQILKTAQKTGRIVFAAMLPTERVQHISNTFVRVHPNGQIEGMDADIQAADDAAHVGEYEPTHGVEWRMEVLTKSRRPISDLGLEPEDDEL